MAQAWAAAMYPHAIQRDWKEDPANVCIEAAISAGEEQFLETTLLPLLHSKQVSLEKPRALRKSDLLDFLIQAKLA
jgi:hypothetical protein